MPKPLPCRKVESDMKLKGWSLDKLARKAGVNYYAACRVLSGNYTNGKLLVKLQKTIQEAPMPKEGATV